MFSTGRRTAYATRALPRRRARTGAIFGDALEDAHPRRARAGIFAELGERRTNGLARDEGHDAAPRAHAHRERGRAGAARRVALEGVLDDAILEGVIGEDREPRAEREARNRVVEEALELDELAVRRDAQRLKNPGRGVLVHLAPGSQD